MIKVVLHGVAKQHFGGPFLLDVRDAPEAVRAIAMQRPGFLDMLRQADWRVVRGSLAKSYELDEQSLGMAIGNAKELHLIPVSAGSASGKGVGKIVAGVALVALSFATGGAAAPVLFGLGASIGLAGVSQVLAKTPMQGDVNDREEEPGSKLFNGGGPNLTEPGHPYPLALGRIVRTGAVVAQVGLSTEQLI